jgi:hypothetical protein
VLLTAIHFHYAGFALPLLTGLAGRALGGRIARIASLGVIAGVPLVAFGITGLSYASPPASTCPVSLIGGRLSRCGSSSVGTCSVRSRA